ncbi:MAG: hypothetical protein KAG84_05420 [Bacteroidales bacterium]|nr:hypothetical protein [Bacteroidales bacterium]
MKNYGVFILLFILLISACKKEEAIEEVEDDVVLSSNFLIDNSSQWTVRSERQLGAPHPFDDYYFIDTVVYYFGGDTSFSKITVYDFDSISDYPSTNIFYKLNYLKKEYSWCLTYEDPFSSPGTLNTTTGTACFIRQDTVHKRVYIARSEKTLFPMLNDEQEYVLYDFNLNVNDTLPYNAWNGAIASKFTVDSLEQIVINGKELKLYKVYENNYFKRGTIIEGIGSLANFINSNGQLIHFQNNEIDFYPLSNEY